MVSYTHFWVMPDTDHLGCGVNLALILSSASLATHRTSLLCLWIVIFVYIFIYLFFFFYSPLNGHDLWKLVFTKILRTTCTLHNNKCLLICSWGAKERHKESNRLVAALFYKTHLLEIVVSIAYDSTMPPPLGNLRACHWLSIKPFHLWFYNWNWS